MFDGRGTQLSMVQTNVPAEKYESINGGWRQYYWTKMSEYLRARKVAPVRRFLEEFKNHANIDVVDETWTPDAVQVQQVWVDPPARRNGYAQRGMRDLCRLLLQRVPTVCLFVRPENQPAIRVYEAIGMQRHGCYRSLIF